MCRRSSLTKTEKEIEERFQSSFYSENLERYNPMLNYNVAECLQMIISYPEDLIDAYQVCDRVGKAIENDKGLIELLLS